MSHLPRRSPRREHILRNRLHPLHQALLSGASTAPQGGSVVERKSPHQRGFIGPNELRRIDRLAQASPDAHGADEASASRLHSVKHLPLHQVDEPAFYVAVIPEMSGGRLTAGDKDMLGLAQQLANGGIGQQPEAEREGMNGDGAVLAILFTASNGDSLAEAGVDRWLDLSSVAGEGYQPEWQLALLQQAEQQFAPRYWLFGDMTLSSADLGRRLAACLDVRAATGVVEIDNLWVWCRSGHSGKEYRRPHESILLVAEQIAEPVSAYRCQARSVSLDVLPEVHARIDDMGLIAVDPGVISLPEAEFVFAGGNGVMDWALFHQAAAALGATEGASRVAVDDGNMPRAAQVGASGTWVSARVYVAVGISGAIQHMQGMEHCDTVIAINLDPGCAMVGRADLSVIGNSTEIMQALVKEAGERWDDAG